MSYKSPVTWPKKAVVTAGMPYGNKALHFGHVGGVFVPADCFSRFLKDRIGYDNVRFISGTDCFGSPIDEGYRKLVEAGKFKGSINDYVQQNHKAQLDTLNKYDIDLSIFEGSGIGECGTAHQDLTNYVIKTLFDNGWLTCVNTKQFYDTQAKMFLNGRQVHGRCPVQGCRAEDAYADECSLGHQYSPEDLIAPKSSVTGTVPEMRTVKNWYFNLPAYRDYLVGLVGQMKADTEIRDVVCNSISEFLAPSIIFVKNECYDSYLLIKQELPKHSYKASEGNKQSFTIEFDSIYDRDEAKQMLTENGIRFRTGKTLVPFRITGNAAWGVKSPKLVDKDGSSQDLTVWCWPESLWAPISFTKAANNILGLENDSWKNFWSDGQATVYQFIGQDNIYFYGVAQPALFHALQHKADGSNAENQFRGLRQTRLVANYHVLFGKTKASSSSEIKPPSADELLEYYTSEQLRSHWLALGLSLKSVGFCPKPFDPDPAKREDPRVADPVLKEGTLLTNVFNRLARSCFYECCNNFESVLPALPVSEEVSALVVNTLAAYEVTMHKVELHSIMRIMDEFIRAANKYWADNIAAVSKDELSHGIDIREGGDPSQKRLKVLSDTFYLLYAATIMMHPVVPKGCEKICEMLGFDTKEFFNWDNYIKGLNSESVWDNLVKGEHKIHTLPPRTDFFRKHESQYKK